MSEKPAIPPQYDVLAQLRHELRTPLNQIIGYSEMLEEDASSQSRDSFSSDLRKILMAARGLTEQINETLQHGRFDPDSDFSKLRHDLRTPLNQIIGYSEMLEEESVDQNTPEFIPDLVKIQKAARALNEVINENLVPGKLGIFLSIPSPYEKPKPASTAGIASDVGVEPSKAESVAVHGHLLVVDDNENNRDMLSRRLLKTGYTVEVAGDGEEALAKVKSNSFDLVLLDIMMPGLDGYAVLTRMKTDAALRHIPVIMISALGEIESVVRCIETGAEDYLPKPFNPTLLKARIGACLEKKQLRDQEQKTYQALVESQKHLAAELSEAAEYVRSLLPPKLESPIKTDWRFVPSTQLGGDSFGYHWLDSDRFAMYLLDVCGHGVGAALLSISAMNVLRSQSLPATDFGNPSEVLGGLNEAFQMENQNNMYFTIWYGVYSKSQKKICFSSGGHPPSVLLPPGQPPQQLRTQGMVIGSLSGLKFKSSEAHVPAGSKLFIFSDGSYELTRPDGSMVQLETFVEILSNLGKRSGSLDEVITTGRELQGKDNFEDDYSLVQIQF